MRLPYPFAFLTPSLLANEPSQSTLPTSYLYCPFDVLHGIHAAKNNAIAVFVNAFAVCLRLPHVR